MRNWHLRFLFTHLRFLSGLVTVSLEREVGELKFAQRPRWDKVRWDVGQLLLAAQSASDNTDQSMLLSRITGQLLVVEVAEFVLLSAIAKSLSV